MRTQTVLVVIHRVRSQTGATFPLAARATGWNVMFVLRNLRLRFVLVSVTQNTIELRD
jgi:RecA/RadA recombinase